MAAWIDQAYLEAVAGAGWVRAAVDATGADLADFIIPSATDLVRGFLRKNGYAAGGDSTEDNSVKLAIAGACIHMLCTVAEVAVSLPEKWEDHPARVAFDGLRSEDGDVQPDPASHPVESNIAAIGGNELSDTRAATLSEQRVTRASREKLTGY